MGFIGKILSGGIGELVGQVGGVIDSLHTSDEEKSAAKAELYRLANARESEMEQTFRTEIGAKSNVIMAEMKQDDNFTKRARPMVVYAGLVMIFINYTVVPIVSLFLPGSLEELVLPTEFWVAWGGIVSTWVIGRTAEKRGSASKVVSAITGS